MPSANTLRLATEQREAQRKRAAAVAIIIARSLQRLRADDVRGTGRAFVDEIAPFVLRRRRESATLAMDYYNAMRIAETGLYEFLRLVNEESARRPRMLAEAPEIVIPRRGVDVDEQAIRSSLTVTGPITFVQALKDGRSESQARQAAQVAAGGAGVRHTLNGGREAGMAVAAGDPAAVGYQRVTKGPTACYFCVALASRGPVYEDDSFDMSDPRFTGSGEVKVHDSCGCLLIPAYSRTLTPEAERLREEWERNASGNGQERMRSFRRYWESREA